MLVQQQPLLAGALLARPDQYQAAVQLLAINIGVQLARGDGGRRVVARVRFPGAAVPHDHVTAAVLTRRDHPLEVEVFDRMILNVDRGPLQVRIEGRALGHSPAHEHAVDLEPEVVVQPAGAVPLHHEPAGTWFLAQVRRAGFLAQGRRAPAWGAREIPLPLIRRERVGPGCPAAAVVWHVSKSSQAEGAVGGKMTIPSVPGSGRFTRDLLRRGPL